MINPYIGKLLNKYAKNSHAVKEYKSNSTHTKKEKKPVEIAFSFKEFDSIRECVTKLSKNNKSPKYEQKIKMSNFLNLINKEKHNLRKEKITNNRTFHSENKYKNSNILQNEETIKVNDFVPKGIINSQPKTPKIKKILYKTTNTNTPLSFNKDNCKLPINLSMNKRNSLSPFSRKFIYQNTNTIELLITPFK